MEPPDAREWGRRQAAASPVWSEAKWRRVGAILGVELVASAERVDGGKPEDDDQDQAVAA